MEFTKIDPSAFDRLHNRKRAQFFETNHSLEKRSRHLMEQSALLKHDIDTFKNDLAAIGIQGYPTGVTAHVCECAPLCPAIWSTLPLELLELVFARLPLPNIIRLRVLSKTWDRYVTGVTPGFTKLCAEQNPNMFALISQGSKFDGGNGPMSIKVYDSKQARWHQYVHETCVFKTCDTMSAGDGGLVCLVSTARDKDVNIVVFNPLTRQWRELPPPPPPPPPSSSLTRSQPRMVQLVMDQDNSKCYKVLVVGQRGGDAGAMIFSSATGKWSKPNLFSDLIFGYQHSWRVVSDLGYQQSWRSVSDLIFGYQHSRERDFHCAYDCASSALLKFDDGSYPSDKFEKDNVLVKGRLFAFHNARREPGYLLEEYQVQSCEPHYVPRKQHECHELDELCMQQECHELDELYMTQVVVTRLFGCQNFLLVSACAEYHSYEARHKQALLFDLSTNQWQKIPEIPECCRTEPEADMFELRWDAVP